MFSLVQSGLVRGVGESCVSSWWRILRYLGVQVACVTG